MTDPVDAAAQAIWRCHNLRAAQYGVEWSDISDTWKDRYRRMAQAAIDAYTTAMGFEEQWSAVADGLGPHPERTRQDAETSLNVMRRNSATYQERQGRIPDFALNPHIVSRLVSPWTRAGENDE